MNGGDSEGTAKNLHSVVPNSAHCQCFHVPLSYMTISPSSTIGIPVSPPLLDNAERIVKPTAGKPVYLFLDYDGTLTPIVPDPTQAYLSRDMRDLLTRVVGKCRTSIVTGRGKACINSFVGPELMSKVSLAASHGFDIHLGTDGYLHVGDSTHLAEFIRFKTELKSRLLSFPPGCAIEETGYSITLHFRHVEPDLHSLVEQMFEAMLSDYPDLAKIGAKMAFEARIKMDWHKGKAVEWILANTGADVENGYVIYIGDDLTDEDAFTSIKQYPHNLSLIVASDEGVGRATSADYRLRDQDDVMKFLRNLVNVQSRGQ